MTDAPAGRAPAPFHVPFDGGRVRPRSRLDASALLHHANSANVARFPSTRFPHPYTAAVRALLPAAVERFGLLRVTAYAATANLASIRVLESVGFQREGLMRARAVRDGEVQDHAVFGWVDEARLQRASRNS